MNKLDTKKRAQVLACLVEGNSIRSTCRLTGVAKNTVVKLLADAGKACSEYQDKTLRGIKSKRIQCDEIWSFVGCKEKNVTAEKKREGQGDAWTWTALEPHTKLVPCWFVGTRDAGCAYHFMHDLASRLANRVQLTTDGHKAYLSAVEDAFGSEIDYAMLVKIYGNDGRRGEVRYSPAVCMGAKKVENHEHAIALHFMHYNFCRIHKTLRVTPAMEAGIADHVWEISEIVALIAQK